MGQSSPFVSVVLPCYNRAGTLLRAVASVLCQTISDIELIIVDDGSTDESWALVSKLGDQRVRYVRHERRMGANAARNTGARLACGEWIAFQDSDDVWLPHKLETQLGALLARSGAGGAYSRYVRLRVDGVELEPACVLPTGRAELHRSLLGVNLIGTPTLVVKRSIFEETGGFDESLPRFQDWEFALRISSSHDLVPVDEVLVVAHDPGGGVSKSPADGLRALQHILASNRQEYRTHPRAHARVLARKGDLHRIGRSRVRGFLAYLGAWWLSPTRVRLLLLSVVTLIGFGSRR